MFDDLFEIEDFIIDPDELHPRDNESWDSGIEQDIFSTGTPQDIFSTRD